LDLLRNRTNMKRLTFFSRSSFGGRPIFLFFTIDGFYCLMHVSWQSVEAFFDLGPFVFPFCVGVGALSVFEEGFFGLIKDLQQLFGAFNCQLHKYSRNEKLVIRLS
jgi:hypothetical protein